jgi:glc operon protein GlcG
MTGEQIRIEPRRARRQLRELRWGVRKPQDSIERSNPGEARKRERLYLKNDRPIPDRVLSGQRDGPENPRAKIAMTKLGITIGILATVFCLPAEAQTISVMILDQAGAQTVLQSARENAQQRNAPSAIAVVDPAGDLLAFQRMDGVRPASADLAIQKARTAARLQRPTAEIEDSINQGRTAFVTAEITALRGGMPVRVNGEVVGAVGIAGSSKETDAEIARTAAAALSPSSQAPLHD